MNAFEYEMGQALLIQLKRFNPWIVVIDANENLEKFAKFTCEAQYIGGGFFGRGMSKIGIRNVCAARSIITHIVIKNISVSIHRQEINFDLYNSFNNVILYE